MSMTDSWRPISASRLWRFYQKISHLEDSLRCKRSFGPSAIFTPSNDLSLGIKNNEYAMTENLVQELDHKTCMPALGTQRKDRAATNSEQ